LIPGTARAIMANKLTKSYTVVRQGLLMKGHEAFAEAMISLNPKAASSDFLDYLALAPPEELRQLTLSSVNLYTCMVILQHLAKVQAPISHPRIENLFFYSVSRANGLAELAQSAIERYLPRNKEHLAYNLTKLPVWVQIAYLENARRRMNPKVGILLAELKKVSSQRDVIEEIDEVIR